MLGERWLKDWCSQMVDYVPEIGVFLGQQTDRAGAGVQLLRGKKVKCKQVSLFGRKSLLTGCRIGGASPVWIWLGTAVEIQSFPLI